MSVLQKQLPWLPYWLAGADAIASLLIYDYWSMESKKTLQKPPPSSCVALLCSFLSSPPLFSIRHNLGKFLSGGDRGSLDWSLLCNLLNQQLIVTVVLLPLDVDYAGQGRGSVTRLLPELCGSALCSTRGFCSLIPACQLQDVTESGAKQTSVLQRTPNASRIWKECFSPL